MKYRRSVTCFERRGTARAKHGRERINEGYFRSDPKSFKKRERSSAYGRESADDDGRVPQPLAGVGTKTTGTDCISSDSAVYLSDSSRYPRRVR